MAAPIPAEAGRSPIHGKGCFASRAIAEGELIGEYTGSPTQQDGVHVLWVEDDDGTFFGIDGDSVLRWLNHSSEPNVEFDGPRLYALRAIAIGEELTFHYGEEWAHVP